MLMLLLKKEKDLNVMFTPFALGFIRNHFGKRVVYSSKPRELRGQLRHITGGWQWQLIGSRIEDDRKAS